MEIMRIGSLAGSDATIYSLVSLTWSDGPIKILGIQVYNNSHDTQIKNYKSKLSKIENIFKIWKGRSLTLIGIIQIVNVLAIPQLIYCIQSLPSPMQQTLI